MNRMESAFTVLAEPNRRAMLTLLAASERTVGELERRLHMSQPSVSKHLRVLREAGDDWTLVLVRELRKPPATVWKALTDPAQLREWAPFDADRNLSSVGQAKLSTFGTPQVSETTVKRAEEPKLLEYDWGGGDL